MKKFNLIKYIPLFIVLGIGGTALVNNFGWDLFHSDYLTYAFVIGGALLGGKSHQYIKEPCKLLKIVLPFIKQQYMDNPKVINLIDDLYGLICEEDEEDDDSEVKREKKNENREEEEEEEMVVTTSCINDSCSDDDDCA